MEVTQLFVNFPLVITTFAVVTAAAATGLTYGTLIIITFANLFGDAIAMAIGDYLSSAAEGDHADAERKREEWFGLLNFFLSRQGKLNINLKLKRKK